MARILVADDDRAIRRIVRDRLVAGGYDVEVVEDGQAALAAVERFAPDLVLLDLAMPELDGFGVLAALPAPAPLVIVITAHGDVATAVRAMRAGAWDFVPKPFDPDHLEQVIARALDTGRLRRDCDALRRAEEERHALVVGASRAMRDVVATAERAAATDATVLLTGESGTGKEVLARHVHRTSRRGRGPFIAINCGALPGELVESELFGHERGAFTGAVRTRPGRIEAASGGTLFLDEIGELPLAAQTKLLRVVQERELERVGGSRTIRVDVRIVAATNRDLDAAVARGAFRTDLYYRIRVVPIQVPPLRERREDIVELAEHVVARLARELGRPAPSLTDDARALLTAYAWPGNVRELANALERAFVLGAGDTITADDLPEELHEHRDAPPTVPGAPPGFHDAVAAAKRAILREALDAEGGHQTRAARRLGLTQPYMARLLKKLNVRA